MASVREAAQTAWEAGRKVLELGSRLVSLGRPPKLGAIVQNASSAGLMTSPHTRLEDAKWLGPYTPDFVPHYIRKRMRRDPQIALGLAALKSPFFGISYWIDSKSGTPTTRAFLRRVLLESKIFEHLIWSCLNSLDFGYQSHELIWALADVTIDPDGDGGRPAETLKNRYVLKKIRDIDPERVEILVDAFDELAGINVSTDFLGVSLPAEKVLHAVHQKEFDNLLGESILDHDYNPWFFCNVQYLLLNRYLEQRGNPPLIGMAPNELRYDEDRAREGQKPQNALDVLARQMAALRSGGACSLPFEVDEKSGNLKWSIDVLADGGRTETFIHAINHYEGLKLRGLYVPERIATQDKSVGSHALAETHLDVFFGMLEVIKKRTVLAPINEVAALLQCANFGDSVSLARVEASEISRLKHELLGELVKQIIHLPRRHDDGTFFTGADMVDLPAALQAVNVPRRRLQDLPPGLPAPSAAPSGAPAPKSEEAKALAEIRALEQEIRILGGGPRFAPQDSREDDSTEGSSLEPGITQDGITQEGSALNIPRRRQVVLNILDAPPPPAPVVENHIHVEPTPVHVHVEPTPVTIENRVETPSVVVKNEVRTPDVHVRVEPTPVTVENRLELPDPEGYEVERDELGRVKRIVPDSET